jgi:hypothetical protein
VRVAQKLPLILTFSPKEGVEKHLFAVIPAPAYYLRGQAPAGIPKLLKPLDSRLRGNDSEVEILH